MQRPFRPCQREEVLCTSTNIAVRIASSNIAKEAACGMYGSFAVVVIRGLHLCESESLMMRAVVQEVQTWVRSVANARRRECNSCIRSDRRIVRASTPGRGSSNPVAWEDLVWMKRTLAVEQTSSTARATHAFISADVRRRYTARSASLAKVGDFLEKYSMSM